MKTVTLEIPDNIIVLSVTYIYATTQGECADIRLFGKEEIDKGELYREKAGAEE